MTKLNPGRELDALVAEKVMGWKNIDSDLGDMPNGRELVEIPYYSTDIAAAWLVVEKIINEHRSFPAAYISLMRTLTGYNAAFCEKEQVFAAMFGETAPHAICLAALKACGVEA